MQCLIANSYVMKARWILCEKVWFQRVSGNRKSMQEWYYQPQIYLYILQIKKLLQYLQKVDKKTDTNMYSKDFLNVRKPNKLSVNLSPAFVAKRHLAAVQIPARLSRDSFRRHKIEVHFIAWTARWEVHFRYATLVRDKVTAEFECFFESTRGTWQSFCQRPLRWDYLSNALNDVMTIKMCVSPKRRQQFGLYSFVY